MSVKSAILNALMAATILAFVLQCVIDASSENVASGCIVMISSLSLLSYIKWSGCADDQPLSSLAIFGFGITTQLGALLVQTGFWTPLRLSLYNPLVTFGSLAGYQAIAIAMHMLYRYFSVSNPQRNGLLRSLFAWGGVYRVPQSRMLWAMGCIGLLSFLVSSRIGLAARIASGFTFFAWAPFLLPLYIREFGPSYCHPYRNQVMVVCYAILVVVLGIALNVRGVMFIGMVTVGLLYLLIGMRSRKPLLQKSVMRLGLLALVMAALAPPLSNLATAMAIARSSRGKLSPVEMVQRTLSVWSRPALIAEYRRGQSAVSRFAAYDEHYIANPLLARFVETKFHDNSFHFAAALTTEDSKDRLRNVTIAATWATLPTPILRLLDIAVDKADLDYSMCDYLVYLSRGVPLGGRKTGSMFAQGQAIMGPLFPILYAVLCILFYGAMDLLTVRTPTDNGSLSTLAMMTLWVFFYHGITSDALSNEFVFLLRDFGQTVVIYVIMFGLIRLMLGSRHVRTQSSVVPG